MCVYSIVGCVVFVTMYLCWFQFYCYYYKPSVFGVSAQPAGKANYDALVVWHLLIINIVFFATVP